jgi:internalin A
MALSEDLVRRGFHVWNDKAIPIGADWAETIRESLGQSHILIALLSPDGVRSDMVRSEYQYNLQLGRPVLPIVFGSFERLPLELRHIQAIFEELDALERGPSSAILEQITEAIAALLSAPPSRTARRHRAPRVVEENAPTGQPRTPEPPVAPEARKPKRRLNEGKLILVGRGGVGKTSLVRRLIRDQFSAHESKTEGIKIDTWPLTVKGVDIRLNVWDFGGQEIMHATHQFFLTEKSVYLLVLSGREGREDADVEYWLRHIQGFGGASPVIVVQNKMGEHPFELNYRGLQARYAQIRGFVKTDCEDALGIAEVRDHILAVLEQVPEISMTLPADWYAIKERLEATATDYIGYDTFREICAKEGVTDDGDRNALAFVLHCLGIALNYRSDSRLRETSILKPEWITEGIYKILNAPKLAHRHGELHLEDLGELLPLTRYPSEKHGFLLELMRKFNLCFAFSDARDRYLIPELLGKEEPKEAAEFAPAVCLNFEYHYSVLPEGMIPRFIVRSYTLSRGQPRWRSGVVLAHDGCRALVTAVPAERRIVVRVLGGDARTRRSLLAIIRYDLDQLNAEFKDFIGAVAKVPLAGHAQHAIDYGKLVAFERQGVQQFPEFIDGHVVNVLIAELLNGIDLEADRAPASGAFKAVPLVFFSYSHADEILRDELETHLKLLQRQRVIASWHDRKLLPGGDWDKEIDSRLDAARIILLLVSADFLASDYCWEKEVERAIERHDRGDAQVVPILLRACDWESSPFAKIQGLPTGMKPVKSWADRDDAWTNVAKGIRKLAEGMVG